MRFQDGNGKTLDRTSGCYDENKSVCDDRRNMLCSELQKFISYEGAKNNLLPICKGNRHMHAGFYKHKTMDTCR